jgi:hypothetical protein
MTITIKRSATLPPKEISHYTTLDGLKGIIQSGCLWASNASFLNDKAELLHALGVSRVVIKQLTSKKNFEAWMPELEGVFEEFATKGIPDTYVTCFCDTDDNLSQWRGYGGSAQGISLNFNRVKMVERLKRERAVLFKVSYTKHSTAQKISAALIKELEDIAELDDLIGLSPDQRSEQLKDRVSKLLPRFKHLGFADEREWRFVTQKAVTPDSLCFRVSNNKLVPYIEIGKAKEKMPITSARVGPGPDQELTAQSVKVFLISNGYDVPVYSSDIPFRV